MSNVNMFEPKACIKKKQALKNISDSYIKKRYQEKGDKEIVSITGYLIAKMKK